MRGRERSLEGVRMSAVGPRNGGEDDLIRRQREFRDLIADMLWGCGIYSNTGLSFIELSDDAALEYSIRQIIARVKIARDVMAMLKACTTLQTEITDAART
jgi:hypothetical protein